MSKTAIVADRDDAVRGNLEVFLTKMGYEVTTAENGEGVLSRLAAEPPALILFDSAVTLSDGRGMLGQLTDAYPQVSVIVMDRTPTIEAVINALRHGACDYIVKPFSFVELKAAVDRAFDRHELISDCRAPSVADPGPPQWSTSDECYRW
jgi:DNA-binding NtrC family response regulator